MNLESSSSILLRSCKFLKGSASQECCESSAYEEGDVDGDES